MAGANADFDAAAFRDAIRSAMQMGMPANISEQGTFKWKRQETFGNHDNRGEPYNWSATPVTDVQHPPVVVPIAIEVGGKTSVDNTAVGVLQTPTITITILDDDYARVRGAEMVEFDGATYDIEYVGPPIGLFDVTIYSIYCRARDES